MGKGENQFQGQEPFGLGPNRLRVPWQRAHCLGRGFEFSQQEWISYAKGGMDLLIPVGQSLRIDPELAPYLEETDFVGDLPYSSLAGHLCMITYKGLVRLGH